MGCCSSKPKTLHVKDGESLDSIMRMESARMESKDSGESRPSNTSKTKSNIGEREGQQEKEDVASQSKSKISGMMLRQSTARLFLGDEVDVPEQKSVERPPSNTLSFEVVGAQHLPVGKREKDKLNAGKDGYIVRVCVFDKTGKLRYPPVHSSPSQDLHGSPIWNLHLEFSDICDTDMVSFSVRAVYFNETSRKRVGKTLLSVEDFRAKKQWDELWLFDRTAIAVFDKAKLSPTCLKISSVSTYAKGILSKSGSVPLIPYSREGDVVLDDHESGSDGEHEDEDVEIDGFGSISGTYEGSTPKPTSEMDENPLDSNQVELKDNPSESEESEDDSHPLNDEAEGKTDETDLTQDFSQATLDTHDSADQTLSKLSTGGERKHVLIITRGTRGDVQPFIALARGLAEILGWTVTICTELRYRSMIRRYSKVGNGKVQFRPSGGDTETRIAAPIAKWAVSTKMRLMHAAMLARTEREFFDSEPAFFYWAKVLKPDVLCYTFTTANITMVISEALKIPSVGFFLQPTVIPSKQYPAIVPLRLENLDSEANQLEVSGLESHKVFRFIKGWFENNVFSRRIEEMRKLRGLPAGFCQENDFERIIKAKLPLIVPIKAKAFGGKPDDWPGSFRLTDFIFLRGGATPDLDEEMENFIQNARKNGNQVVVICFSSMPISRIKVAEAALLMLDKCPSPYKPCIIALIGDRPDNEPKSPSLEARLKEYVDMNRLLVAKGAPFSKLFPRMDFIILHGGLGTTAEALAAGVPCMVTGVLLMDQRFWGRRVFQLGVGPPPCHISDFNSKILDILPDALNPAGSFAQNARKVAQDLFPEGLENLSDGVHLNVETFVECYQNSFPAPTPNFQSRFTPLSISKKRRNKKSGEDVVTVPN